MPILSLNECIRWLALTVMSSIAQMWVASHVKSCENTNCVTGFAYLAITGSAPLIYILALLFWKTPVTIKKADCETLLKNSRKLWEYNSIQEVVRDLTHTSDFESSENGVTFYVLAKDAYLITLLRFRVPVPHRE